MKLPILCTECARGFGSGFSNGFQQGVVTIEDIRDDGIYTATCSKGHTTKTILQEQKFEILFQIGAYAIADGYYREAISSFTSSLELLYDFFIRAVLFQKNIDNDAMERNRNITKNQSERQLGAFVALYTFELGQVPLLLHGDWVNYRNKVVHQGLIPNREKAICYGEEVRKVMLPIIKAIKERYPSGIKSLLLQHLNRDKNPIVGMRTSTMSISTIVSLMRGSVGEERSLDATIAALPRVK